MVTSSRVLFIFAIVPVMVTNMVSALSVLEEPALDFKSSINECWKKHNMDAVCGNLRDYTGAITCFEKIKNIPMDEDQKDVLNNVYITSTKIRQSKEKTRRRCPKIIWKNVKCLEEYEKNFDNDRRTHLFSKENKDVCKFVKESDDNFIAVRMGCSEREDEINKKILTLQSYENHFCNKGQLRQCTNKDWKMCVELRNPWQYKNMKQIDCKEKIAYKMRECFNKVRTCDDKDLKMTKETLLICLN